MATQNSIDSQDPIQTALGGTGLASPTAHKLLVGAGSSALTQIAVGTTGQTLLGNTGSDPSWGAPLAPASTCAFNAYVTTSVTTATGDGTAYTIIADTKNFDLGTNYATASGIFTAPNSGYYHLGFTITCDGLLTANNVFLAELVIGGTDASTIELTSLNAFASGGGTYGGAWSQIVPMAATDTAKVVLTVSGGTKVVRITGQTTLSRKGTVFWGYQIA